MIRSEFSYSHVTSAFKLPGSRWAGSSRLAHMYAFRDLFDHLAVEGRDIVRVAAGDEAVINDHFFVNPVRTGVLQIGTKRRIRGQRAAFDNARVDQRPRRMTDRRDRLACIEESAHKGLCGWIHTQLVRVHHAAREE